MVLGRLRNLFSGGSGEGEVPAEAAAPPATPGWMPGWQPRPPADPEWRPLSEDGRFGVCGRVLRSQHMPDEFYASLRLDLAVAEAIVGPDSPRLIDLLISSSGAANATGDLASAARFAQRVLDMAGREGVIPADLATAEMKFGEIARAEGRWPDVVERFERALRIREESLGPDHRHAVALRDFLARAADDPQVLEIPQPPTDERDRLLATAEKACAAGRPAEAEEFAREAYNEAIFTGSCGPVAARACLLLADILTDQGLTGDAQKYLFHHADILGLAHGLAAPETLAALDRLQRNTDIIRRGEAWQRESNPWLEAVRDETHLHVWLMPRLLGAPEQTAPRLRWGIITEAYCEDGLSGAGKPALGADPDAQAAVVAFDVGADGATAEVEIVESSGSPLIDDRLRALVGGLVLSPARDNGQPARTRIRQRIQIHDGSFELATPERAQVERKCVALLEGRDGGQDLWIHAPDCGRLPRRARRTQGEFFADDYPEDSLERGEEGTVRVDFMISAEGLAEEVRVGESSGFEALDARACAIIHEHFQFDPARDEMGNPVPQASHQAVTWRLPEDEAS